MGAILNTEPLLGAGLCADVPQRQYDWFCAVCRAVFPSAGAGAGPAVTVGGVLQLAYQLPHLKKIGMLVLPRINLKDAGAMRVVKQMGPAILACR